MVVFMVRSESFDLYIMEIRVMFSPHHMCMCIVDI